MHTNRPITPHALRLTRHPLIELILITLWAAWIGRSLLDFDLYHWPVGGEWGTQLLTHQIWIYARECGLCGLWNGGVNGGAPGFADLFGSMLHPLVIVTTMLWGVVVGAKVTLVIAFAMGGWAQWWIAHTLRLNPVARVWSGMLAVVGGHLAGRMENGNFGLTLSTAACSLALAGAFAVWRNGDRRATLALAITGAFALLSGQAYMQLALLGWSPALLLTALWRRNGIRTLREYVAATALASMLAGVLFVPLLHFWPHVTKDIDLTFRAAQPWPYIPLNLVLPQTTPTTTLGRLPYPYLYNLYIGVIPTALALIGLLVGRRELLHARLCLVIGATTMFWLASPLPWRWFRSILPILANARHTPLIAGLAVPAILGLSALGLDRLLWLPWLARPLIPKHILPVHLDARWLLAVPLFWSLVEPAQQAQFLLRTADARPIYRAIAGLRTPDLQWVAPPFGELRWTQAGLDQGLKLSPVVWVYRWREPPLPKLEALRPGAQSAMERYGPLSRLPWPYGERELAALGGRSQPMGALDNAVILRYPDQHYAGIVFLNQSQLAPCQASGQGGSIQVTCASTEAGYLIVREHAWSGWTVWRDGQQVTLESGKWLRVAAPPGEHRYVFRYRPWDVWLGVSLSLSGAALCVWLWRRQRAN